ncbi:MAG: hypothetical protein OXC03_10075 [Flavobacteriaceae bacterium]|nr:hypothetical protein [Flavobacteriaceae bacterium]
MPIPQFNFKDKLHLKIAEIIDTIEQSPKDDQVPDFKPLNPLLEKRTS